MPATGRSVAEGKHQDSQHATGIDSHSQYLQAQPAGNRQQRNLTRPVVRNRAVLEFAHPVFKVAAPPSGRDSPKMRFPFLPRFPW